jgi:hypothetical protein
VVIIVPCARDVTIEVPRQRVAAPGVVSREEA